MPTSSSPSTSSWSPPSASACASSSSSSATIAANSSTSTSPITLRPSGRRASWSRPFRRTTAPRDLLRDRDRIYGQAFSRRVERMGIHEVHIAPRAPWQNPFAERVIGSLRREGLDHFLILSEAHLRRLRRAYGAYDNTTWPHQSLENSSPQPGSSPFLRSE